MAARKPGSGLLTNVDILDAIKKKELTIANFERNSLSAIGYDLRVGDEGWIWKKKKLQRIDIKTKRLITLKPGDTGLIVTKEDVRLESNIAGTIHSKVTMVSLGFSSISTTIDPGWGNLGGLLLIRVTNLGKLPLSLNYEEPFCTAVFWRTASPTDITNVKPGRRTDISNTTIPKLIEDQHARTLSLFRGILEPVAKASLSLLLGLSIAGLALILTVKIITVPLEVVIGPFFIGGIALSVGFMSWLLRR